jgi:hypothetical protein
VEPEVARAAGKAATFLENPDAASLRNATTNPFPRRLQLMILLEGT